MAAKQNCQGKFFAPTPPPIPSLQESHTSHTLASVPLFANLKVFLFLPVARGIGTLLQAFTEVSILLSSPGKSRKGCICLSDRNHSEMGYFVRAQWHPMQSSPALYPAPAPRRRNTNTQLRGCSFPSPCSACQIHACLSFLLLSPLQGNPAEDKSPLFFFFYVGNNEACSLINNRTCIWSGLSFCHALLFIL